MWHFQWSTKSKMDIVGLRKSISFIERLLACSVVSLHFPQSLSAQSQLVNEMSNAVTELTGSFMDNPYHHSNTIKLYDLTQQFKKTADEVYSEAL